MARLPTALAKLRAAAFDNLVARSQLDQHPRWLARARGRRLVAGLALLRRAHSASRIGRLWLLITRA